MAYDKMTEHLQELLQIPSEMGEPAPGMPFGEQTYRSLMYMLDLGEQMGFAVKDVDGYAGHIEWGQGEEIFGVLCHLDVVPAGGGWTYPPYSAIVADGKIYARGAQDNKSPAVSVLYAAKRLMDEGFVPKRKFRLILGLNEESGWKCIDYYLKKEQMPAEGFSPDSDFPVINCEKGVLHMYISFETAADVITQLDGGYRTNMVPDKASYTAGGKRQEFKGISAHGSRPEKGENAVKALLIHAMDAGIQDVGIRNIYDTFFGEDNLKKLELDLFDQKSGKLTCNLGTIQKNGGIITCGVDIRFPVSYDKEYILAKLSKNLPRGCTVKLSNFHDPLYVDEGEPLVQKLLKAYEKVTGEKGKCISIGGATYSRALDKCVAFGPVFPGEDSKIHTADESIAIDSLMKMTDIYYEALKMLL